VKHIASSIMLAVLPIALVGCRSPQSADAPTTGLTGVIGAIIDAVSVTNVPPPLPGVVTNAPDPDTGGSDFPPTLPGDSAGVENNNGVENSLGWPITVEIEDVRIVGPSIVWRYKSGEQRQRGWPVRFEDLNACVNIIATIDGKETAFVAEWLRPGGKSQSVGETLRSKRHNGKRMFEAPYQDLVIKPEHKPQLYLSGYNWRRLHPQVKINVRERSNAVPIRW
jgi:hypothetical protein